MHVLALPTKTVKHTTSDEFAPGRVTDGKQRCLLIFATNTGGEAGVHRETGRETSPGLWVVTDKILISR